MHVLFVHQNFPAQFGHIARHLIRTRGWTCTFVSKTPAGDDDGIRKIAVHDRRRGARDDPLLQPDVRERRPGTPTASTEACQAQARLAARPDRRPQRVRLDAVPARALPRRADHQLLRVLLSSARVRHGLPPRVPPGRARLPPGPGTQRHAPAGPGELPRGYSPTHFQRQLFPETYRSKIDVIFDGIETDLFRRRDDVPRRVGDRSIPPSTRIVTYVSRGFESMRGFDIFMKVADGSTGSFPTLSSSWWAATGSATAATRSTSGTRRSSNT